MVSVVHTLSILHSIGTFHFPVYQKLGGSLGGVVTEWDEHYGLKMLSILHYLFSSLTMCVHIDLAMHGWTSKGWTSTHEREGWAPAVLSREIR